MEEGERSRGEEEEAARRRRLVVPVAAVAAAAIPSPEPEATVATEDVGEANGARGEGACEVTKVPLLSAAVSAARGNGCIVDEDEEDEDSEPDVAVAADASFGEDSAAVAAADET